MKKLLILSIILLASCSLDKVVQHHGVHNLEKKQAKLKVNRTNKNEILALIGPPSTKSDFNDTWMYFERKKTNQSLFKLGKKKISKNNVIKVNFNEFGLVSNKELLNLDDMNDIKISKMKTNKKFSVNNFAYNILSTLREKINAPTRKKRE